MGKMGKGYELAVPGRKKKYLINTWNVGFTAVKQKAKNDYEPCFTH